jgi:hypothetical protein
MAPRIYVGRFDPKFLGVAIRGRRPADVHSFRLSDHDRRPQLSVLTGLADDAFISDLSRSTVLDHEIRHFHDALLFPFGHLVTRARIFAAFNGFTAATWLRAEAGTADTIVVPLQQWLRMTEAERTDFLAGAAPVEGRPFLVPELPVIPVDDDVSSFGIGVVDLEPGQEALVAGCRLALADYRRIEQLWRSPSSPEAPATAPTIAIWEAAGLLCQLAAIDALTTSEVMNRFSYWIQANGPHTYRRGLQVLDLCVERLEWPATLRNVLAIATWSQMGAPDGTSDGFTPEYRLGRLVGAAQRGSRWSDDESFVDLISAWDEVVGSNSIAAIGATGGDLDQFARYVTGGVEQRVRLLDPRLFEGLDAARRRMRSAFLDDPDTYIDPAAYRTHRSDYPLPCIGVSYPTASGDSDWTDVTPAGWSPEVDFDATLGLTAMAELTDSLFLPGEKSLLTAGRHRVREAIGLEPVRVIR